MSVSPANLPVLTLAAQDILQAHRFRAMNTDVAFLSPAPLPVADVLAAERLFHDIESRFSRFRPDSELSRLNARAGEAIRASGEMISLLAQARRYHRVTGGVFEPAILPALEAAGYDRSFEQVTDVERTPVVMPHGSIADVRIDSKTAEVTAPAGVRTDLGGIGKGYAVDRARRLFAGNRGVLIDAGGDIFAMGHGPDRRGWIVEVSDPFERAGELTTVRLYDQGVATSTTAVRRWRAGDTCAHHIIDPRTGAPARTDVISVSVIAPTTTDADVFAKTALVLGSEEGTRFIERRGVAALFVLESGATRTTSRWPVAERPHTGGHNAA